MIDPNIYLLLMVASWVLIIVGAVSLFLSIFAGDDVESGSRLLSIKKHPGHPDVKKALRNRKIWRGLSVFGILLGAFFPLMVWVTGEPAAQHQHRIEEVRGIAQDFFIEDLTDADVEGLLGDGATLEVISSDGSTQKLRFDYVEWAFRDPAIYIMETGGDYRAGTTASIRAEEQAGWLLKRTVADEVQSRYGVEFTADQLDLLAVPTEVPSTLTRYGTAPVTVAVAGGYLNADATLIWDGEFKLVGIPGAEQELLELPLAPGGSDR